MIPITNHSPPETRCTLPTESSLSKKCQTPTRWHRIPNQDTAYINCIPSLTDESAVTLGMSDRHPVITSLATQIMTVPEHRSRCKHIICMVMLPVNSTKSLSDSFSSALQSV